MEIRFITFTLREFFDRPYRRYHDHILALFPVRGWIRCIGGQLQGIEHTQYPVKFLPQRQDR